HGGALLTGYQALRAEGFLCDVTLEAEGSEFLAHRSLLACSSDYFRALFKSHTRESRASVIHLHVPSAAGLQRLLDFIYTAWLPLSMDTVEDTLEAASYLQVTEALGLCGRYLERRLAPDNCCFAANVAARFGLAHTLGAAESCIVHHLRELLARGAGPAGLLELNPASLRAVLGAPDVARVPEAHLLGLALAWLRREPAAERLAHCSFDVYNHRWRSLTRLPAPLLGHSVCAVGNFLFVLGGESPADTASAPQAGAAQVITAQVHRYDPRFHAWTPVPAMREARAHFWCGVVGEGLLAVGGLGADGEALASVEMYDLRRDRWTAAAPLPRALHGHAGAVGDRSVVYISGGKAGRGEGGASSLRDVFALCPGERMWSKKAPMGTARFGHHMAALRGAVFAFLGRYEPFSEIERYDPGADQWTRLRPLPYDRFCYGLAVVEETALLLGGLKWRDSRQVPTRNVVGYDLDLDRWEDIGCALPWAWSGLQCAVLQLPEGRDEERA
uniref:Kelch like family member 34 n=1 Tax=Loxodonta africana TaxID=9785 RepID=G5E795_LOXAF